MVVSKSFSSFLLEFPKSAIITLDTLRIKLSFFYFSFRHEVPVSSEEIKIVHIDDDLVVVNKPASIPVRFSDIVSDCLRLLLCLKPTIALQKSQMTVSLV